MARLSIQRERMAQAQANQLIVNTAAAIYGALVALEDEPIEPDTLRSLAERAKEHAPYLAESFNLIEITKKDEDLRSGS